MVMHMVLQADKSPEKASCQQYMVMANSLIFLKIIVCKWHLCAVLVTNLC